MHTDPYSLALALLAGIALAAACGLRAFLPLLALGLAARFLRIELQPSLAWVAGDVALVTLGAATVLEIAGDKVPVLDHVLDVAATLVRPVTATVAAYGLLVHWPTPWAQILAVLLGGSALALHAAKAKTRVGSTVVSGGAANPVLSVIEDVVSFALVAVAFLAPLLVALVLVFAFWLFTRAGRARRARRENPAT